MAFSSQSSKSLDELADGKTSGCPGVFENLPILARILQGETPQLLSDESLSKKELENRGKRTVDPEDSEKSESIVQLVLDCGRNRVCGEEWIVGTS